MIRLTRLNGGELWLNPFQFEMLDAVPDTRITLMNGHTYFVCETPEDIRTAINDWLRGADVGLGRNIQRPDSEEG